MKIMEGKESAVGDFAAELLRSMGYETEETVIRTRKNIRFTMCGEQVYAKTDVCVLDAASEKYYSSSKKTRHTLILRIPNPQLIAEAITAFQSNNLKRVNDLFVDPLQIMVIPGITMTGTFPKFYKIKKSPRIWIAVSNMESFPLYKLSYTATHPAYPDVAVTECDRSITGDLSLDVMKLSDGSFSHSAVRSSHSA